MRDAEVRMRSISPACESWPASTRSSSRRQSKPWPFVQVCAERRSSVGMIRPRSLASGTARGRRAASPSSVCGRPRTRVSSRSAPRAAARARSAQLVSPALARCQMPRSPSISRSSVACTRSGTYVGETTRSSAASTGTPIASDASVRVMKFHSSHGPKNAAVRTTSAPGMRAQYARFALGLAPAVRAERCDGVRLHVGRILPPSNTRSDENATSGMPAAAHARASVSAATAFNR
jgi:hypothetical protein